MGSNMGESNMGEADSERRSDWAQGACWGSEGQGVQLHVTCSSAKQRCVAGARSVWSRPWLLPRPCQALVSVPCLVVLRWPLALPPARPRAQRSDPQEMRAQALLLSCSSAPCRSIRPARLHPHPKVRKNRARGEVQASPRRQRETAQREGERRFGGGRDCERAFAEAADGRVRTETPKR